MLALGFSRHVFLECDLLAFRRIQCQSRKSFKVDRTAVAALLAAGGRTVIVQCRTAVTVSHRTVLAVPLLREVAPSLSATESPTPP